MLSSIANIINNCQNCIASIAAPISSVMSIFWFRSQFLVLLAFFVHCFGPFPFLSHLDILYFLAS